MAAKGMQMLMAQKAIDHSQEKNNECSRETEIHQSNTPNPKSRTLNSQSETKKKGLAYKGLDIRKVSL